MLNCVRLALRGVDYSVLLSPPQSKPGVEGVVNGQNGLINSCLEEHFDFLWLVQADVQVPEHAFTSLFGLDVDVAQGVVPRHDDFDALICGFLDERKKVWYLPRKAVENQILYGWVFAGMSCTLIKRRVLEAGIRFKYQQGIGEDILFMFDVQKAGFTAKVHGGVICGHLPEWPLTTTIKDGLSKPFFDVLDVGCGHRPKGDVNVDLFVEASAHRAVDQRVNDDVALNVHQIPNFVQAHACYLPFIDRCFDVVFSSHLIEHLVEPEKMLAELIRVSRDKIKIVCPNGAHPSSFGESKPLHVRLFDPSWFEVQLKHFGLTDFDVKFGWSQGEPWEIVVSGKVPLGHENCVGGERLEW